MKYALVQDTRICDFSKEASGCFPVAPELRWVEVPDNTTDRDTYENGVVKWQPYVPPLTGVSVDAERDRRLATIRFGERLYDFCDGRSEQNISGAATLALAAIIAGTQPGDLRWAGVDADFVWIARDNSIVPMDAQTMLAFGQHAAAWKARHIFAGRVLKDMTPIPADYAADIRWPA